jgi:hypothetical protein
VLTSDQFDTLVNPIVELYARYEDAVIVDIARRLSGLDYATSSAAWQVQRLSESGKLYEDILEKLAALTNKSETELRVMFRNAGVRAMRFDDAVYEAAGLHPLPLNLSPQMAEVLAAGLRKTNWIVRNLVQSSAISGQNAFIGASDLAYLEVANGAFSYDQAIRHAVKDLASRGIGSVNYAKRTDFADVAVRRAVLTGVGQTTAELQLTRAAEMEQDLIQVSAHAGSRPAHAEWQGKVFSRSGTSGKYPNFVEKTGYGTALGLAGINCRHSFYPFFEGISQNAYDQAALDEYADRTVTYNKREMDFYTATQEQRGIERKIRHWKRQAAALEAAKVNNLPEVEAVKYYQAQMRRFIRETGIVRQRTRERI